MDNKDEKHHAVLRSADKKPNQKIHALIAAIYLLTSDHQIRTAVKRYTERSGIHMNRIKPQDYTVSACALLNTAKELYLETKNHTIGDPTDDLILAKIFTLHCNAVAIRRFGLGTIENERITEA